VYVDHYQRRGDPEHQIKISCSRPSLLCSVNDAVNVLPCFTWSYLTKENGSSWKFELCLTWVNALQGVQRPAFSLVTAGFPNPRCLYKTTLAFQPPPDYGSDGGGTEVGGHQTSTQRE
jgi:hypothetical protein